MRAQSATKEERPRANYSFDSPSFGGGWGSGGEFHLLCPACSWEYTHHVAVDTFDRAEDAREGRHVSIGETVTIDKDLYGNPSCRRGGVMIRFECEECASQFGLAIIQHKGVTYIGTKVFSSS